LRNLGINVGLFVTPLPRAAATSLPQFEPYFAEGHAHPHFALVGPQVDLAVLAQALPIKLADFAQGRLRPLVSIRRVLFIYERFSESTKRKQPKSLRC